MGKFDQPRNEMLHPLTQRAADGKTTLYRFRVDGIVYAENLAEAQRKVAGGADRGMYLDAAVVVEP